MPPPAPRDDSLFARFKHALGFNSKAGAGAGADGERRAEEFLRRERGFTIVARNWRNPRDRREEIDLVARDGEVLVFIEVKTRAAHALVSGYHTVNSRKKTILRRGIAAYLAALPAKPHTFRFDIVEIAIPAAGAEGSTHVNGRPGSMCEARHYENVPLFPKHFQA